MREMQKARNGGLVIAAIGVVAGLLGILANSSEAGVGANIGAGLLVLVGTVLFALGLAAAVVFVIIGIIRK